MTGMTKSTERLKGQRSAYGGLNPQAIQRQLERILSSTRFHRSERMGRFLKVLVESALEHDTTPTAQEIAVAVFDRPDLNSRTDPIVRVEARRLRKVLAEYYESEGANDPIRISLPSPGYQPRFTRNVEETSTGNVGGRNARSNSIVVLPFLNMTNDPSQEAFCDGVTEELINALTRIDDLKVASRTSAFQYKEARDIREIGKELGVSAVLEGSVRVAEQRVRVTAQLSSASDGFHLWSETFDATFEQGFALQEQLAKAIARMTDSKLEASRS
jgi:TolB-like protein